MKLEEVDAADPIYDVAAVSSAFLLKGSQGADQKPNDVYGSFSVILASSSDEEE